MSRVAKSELRLQGETPRRYRRPPYLHNGSVPTLYHLLLPPAQRPTTFTLGTREFDPERVGYVTTGASEAYATARADVENSFTFRTVDERGRSIPGNANTGHDYGNARLSEADRWASSNS